MTTIQPANPYLICVRCGSWVDHYDNAGINEGPKVNQPCGHAADYRNVCPSWSPVIGCNCLEELAHVPHEQPPADGGVNV